MNEHVSETTEKMRREQRVPNRWLRYSVALMPTVFVGIVNVVKAVRHHDIVEVFWVAAIFFVVCPSLVFVLGKHWQRRHEGSK